MNGRNPVADALSFGDQIGQGLDIAKGEQAFEDVADAGASNKSAQVATISKAIRSSALGMLTERQLAGRWLLSVKKLQRDRYLRRGVPWHLIGRLVRYRLEDVEAYEAAQRVSPDSEA